MHLQLDADMSESLHRILVAAGAVLHQAQAAYKSGQLIPGQIESVFHLRNDLGQLIARFADGYGFTGQPIDYAAINAMRSYEEAADAWLTAVYATVGAVRDGWKRTGPGRYEVTRTMTTADGGTVFRRATCTNPAVATRQFDRLDSQTLGA